jgi:hypothetical protein
MNTGMRRIVLIACTLLLGVGCAGSAYVTEDPPAPQTETRPASPGARFVWIDGHWQWRGHRYLWVSGHWERGRGKSEWVAGHWDHAPRGWHWIPGHWR